MHLVMMLAVSATALAASVVVTAEPHNSGICRYGKDQLYH